DLEAVVMKLLQRDPADRFQTAEAAVAALVACRDARVQSKVDLVQIMRERFPRPGERPTTPAAPSHPTNTAAALPSTLSNAASQSVPMAAQSRPRRGLGLALLGVLAAAGGSAAVFFVAQAHRHRTSSDTAATASNE